MRIAILASSGGSAFIEMKIILDATAHKYEYFVFTDRECRIEEYCLMHQIPCERIKYDTRQGFSKRLSNRVQDIGGVDVVLLYFLRILTPHFFSKHLTLNIHPSLLPSFKGMKAVKQCFEAKVRFIGATLHLVDPGIDTGPIIGQIATPINSSYSEEKLNKISFLQKVYLSLLAIDLINRKEIRFKDDFSSFEIESHTPKNASASPSVINPDFIEMFNLLQKKEGTEIIIT